jgi:hypothetical protein
VSRSLLLRVHAHVGCTSVMDPTLRLDETSLGCWPRGDGVMDALTADTRPACSRACGSSPRGSCRPFPSGCRSSTLSCRRLVHGAPRHASAATVLSLVMVVWKNDFVDLPSTSPGAPRSMVRVASYLMQTTRRSSVTTLPRTAELGRAALELHRRHRRVPGFTFRRGSPAWSEKFPRHGAAHIHAVQR